MVPLAIGLIVGDFVNHRGVGGVVALWTLVKYRFRD
jgi:hypothetical protein